MQLFDTGPCRRGHTPWIPCGNLGDAVHLHGLLVPRQSFAGPSAESRGHDPIRACAGVHHGGWTVRVGAGDFLPRAGRPVALHARWNLPLAGHHKGIRAACFLERAFEPCLSGSLSSASFVRSAYLQAPPMSALVASFALARSIPRFFRDSVRCGPVATAVEGVVERVTEIPNPKP